MQRRLADEGVRFRELLNHVRFEVAVELLRDLKPSVSEIARRLGYDDSSNFARAFQRIAGVSPAAWRRGQQARSR